MSELMNRQCNAHSLRWRLLTTASVLALLGSSIGAAKASNDDTDRPVVWIEFGGQLDLLEDEQQRFAPPFFASVPAAGFASPLALERSSLYSIDEGGKISFQPNTSDWIFSVAVRYGRSTSRGYRHQQTNNPGPGFRTVQPTDARFRYAETTTSDTETHAIFDFMAGKDIGLGALGMKGTSVLSGGLRFAQFQSKSGIAVYTDPDYTRAAGSGLQPNTFTIQRSLAKQEKLHRYRSDRFLGCVHAALSARRRVGNDIRLGGERCHPIRPAKVDRILTKPSGKLSTGNKIPQIGLYYHTTHYTHSAPHNRSQRVTVPNLGAMAGLSFRYANAKVSFGYHVDEFFGAMDGDIDVRKNYNFGLSGPFVNISMGIGR